MWITASASVTGSSHRGAAVGCQDRGEAFSVGKWAILIASDGAGTCKRSAEGAELLVSKMSDALEELASQLDVKQPGNWVIDFLISKILGFRESLRQVAATDTLSDFHCTLVAALVGPSGGFAIHVGDGDSFGGRYVSGVDNATELDPTFISKSSNGEYSNETFFVTEQNWIKNLRISPIGEVDWIMVSTDGASALALEGDSSLRAGFIVPVLQQQQKKMEYADRCQSLALLLGDERADRVSNDDKTLCIAFRDRGKPTGTFGWVSKSFCAAEKSKTSDGHGASQMGGVQNSMSLLSSAHEKKNIAGVAPLKTIWNLFVRILRISLLFLICAGLFVSGYLLGNADSVSPLFSALRSLFS